MVLVWNALVCTRTDNSGKDLPMSSEAEKTLQSSQDPEELFRTAAPMAAGDSSEEHRLLAEYLARQEFLGRLDSEEEYEETPGGLRVRKLVEILAKNRSPSAEAVVLSLTRAPAFTADIERTEILIENLAELRPASPAAVEFWDAHSRPGDVYHNVTMAAVLRNGSLEALALLEKKLTDRSFSHEDKLWWMRSKVLVHRNDLNVLMSCRRVLEGGLLDEPLAVALVEVLFDYRPDDWFGAKDHRPPPPRSLMAFQARSELEALGRYVLSRLPLDEALQETIRGGPGGGDESPGK